MSSDSYVLLCVLTETRSRRTLSVLPHFRFQRQLSEPCVSFPLQEKAVNRPYQPLSCDGRPPYQRHLSEPLVSHGPRGFKQDLVDPRYPEPGPAGPGVAPAQAAFNHVTIKQEPRDFGFDSGVLIITFWKVIFFLPKQRICHFQKSKDSQLAFSLFMMTCLVLSRCSNVPVVIIWKVFSYVPEEQCW